jgi:hypothetical protein
MLTGLSGWEIVTTLDLLKRYLCVNWETNPTKIEGLSIQRNF